MNLPNQDNLYPLVLKAYRQIAGSLQIYEHLNTLVRVIDILSARSLNILFILCCFVHSCSITDKYCQPPSFPALVAFLMC